MIRRFAAATLAGIAAMTTQPARAEFQISAYGGANWNFDSRIETRSGSIHDDRTVGWLGKPFENPPYFGFRGTYWINSMPQWGLALDYTHAKAYADLNFKTDPTYTQLEFTDGNNLLTFNLMYRFAPVYQKLRPYVGGGVGLGIPHVEVFYKGQPASAGTFNYQLAGVAVQGLAGLEYALTPNWSIFGETRLSYNPIDADLNGGGRVKSELLSPHLTLGVSYRFGASEEPLK